MSVKILYVPFRISEFTKNEFVRGWVPNQLDSDEEYPLQGSTRSIGVYKKGPDKGKNAHLHVYYWGDKFSDLLDDEDWIHDNDAKLSIVGHTNRGLHNLYKSPNIGWRDLLILKRFRSDRVVSSATLCDRLVDGSPDPDKTAHTAFTADEYSDEEDELSRISGAASALFDRVSDAMARAELGDSDERDDAAGGD